jgi:hypothetical protein
MKKKIVHRGKVIEVPGFHADRLVASGRASFPNAAPRASEQRVVAAEETQSAEASPVDDAPAPRPKRQYKRRDLRAEEG